MLGIDFVGPLPITPKGNSMILTITDLFSKWTEAYPLPDKQATSVAAALVNLFCNKGIPKAVLSDNGSEFCNEVINLILITIELFHHWSFSKFRFFIEKLIREISLTVRSWNKFERRTIYFSLNSRGRGRRMTVKSSPEKKICDNSRMQTPVWFLKPITPLTLWMHMNKQVDSWLNQRLVAHKVETNYMIQISKLCTQTPTSINSISLSKEY